MIGSALAAQLSREGIHVRRIVRGIPKGDDIRWSPDDESIDTAQLEGLDAIVNLAGAPIAQRWSSRVKRDILESRVNGTRTLARAVAQLARKPRVVLSGSAIGYYGDRGDELLNENSGAGADFLATVVQEWEAETKPLADAGVRVALIRTGIVLSKSGGALAKLLTPFRLGAGGPVGTGKQWMSWISLHDHVRAMQHVMKTERLHGALNFVAPNPVRNADFSHTLGKVLHRPSVLPLPAFALELMFGEMAGATLLASQRVMPAALINAGFAFDDETLEEALWRELGS
jgi:uncharacterized protein (TIGR01777 family)